MTSPTESSDGSRIEVPRPGEILDHKYRVESVLGAGGMGVVLQVEHIELGQRMAIKMMAPGVAGDARAVTRFLREGRAASSLESEHVVRIFDVGTLPSGVPYMVMELLRGDDLSRVLRSGGRFEIVQAVDYVLQACHAIAEAHGLGIVHRDLKPSNLFLTHRSDGSALIKVLDFGISKAIDDGNGEDPAVSLTATSAVMGSPLYMSPEQVRNSRQVDGRTDVWSLGVILYEFLTGSSAFQADTVPGICAAIAADDPPFVSLLRPEVSPELEAVVMRCLEKDVFRRFQSVAELMGALRGFAPVTSRSPPMLLMAQTMPEAGSNAPGTSPSSRAARSRDRRVIVSMPIEGVAHPSGRASSRSSGRPESQKGAIASGGAVALSSQSSEPLSEPTSRSRLALFGGGIVIIGVVAGWMLASLRHDRAAAPPVVSSLAEEKAKSPTSFVLIIDSDPQGAAVVEGSQTLGTTPARISVENEPTRRGPRKLSLQHDGFLPYSIVQGPSDHDVHIVAVLESRPKGAPVASNTADRPPAPVPLRIAKPTKASTAAALASAEPSGVASPVPAPPATPDIRLQR
jgi:serine/threonine protein kinase